MLKHPEEKLQKEAAVNIGILASTYIGILGSFKQLKDIKGEPADGALLEVVPEPALAHGLEE